MTNFFFLIKSTIHSCLSVSKRKGSKTFVPVGRDCSFGETYLNHLLPESNLLSVTTGYSSRVRRGLLEALLPLLSLDPTQKKVYRKKLANPLFAFRKEKV